MKFSIRVKLDSLSALVRRFWLFPMKTRLSWYAIMARLVGDRITTDDALRELTIVSQALKDKASPVYDNMLSVIRHGGTIVTAAEPWVPKSELVLLAAESETRSSQGYKAAEKLVSSMSALRGAFFQAISYPLVLIVVGLFVTITLARENIPVMIQDDSFAFLPLYQQRFAYSALWIGEHWMWVVLLVAAPIIALIYTLPKSPSAARPYLERFSPAHRLFREYSAAALVLSVGSMVNAGMHVDQALKSVVSASNGYVCHHARLMLSRYMYDSSKVLSIFNTGLLSLPVLVRISALHQKEGIAPSLIASADDSLEYAKKSATRIGAVIAILTMIAIALFIAMFYLLFNTLGSAASSAIKAA